MQEKTLLNQANSTSNIHSSEFGSVSYDIFGSLYKKSGSFLVNDSKEYVYTALENTSFPEKIQPYVDELLKRF
jgi:hypothetical protein